MPIQIYEVMNLFTDDFSSSLNPAAWDYSHWQQVNNPSFYGRTQQRQSLPAVSNGELNLKLDTYNPTNGYLPSFYGSDISTIKTFSNDAGGVVFEIKAHFINLVPGIVGGMFPYSTNPDGNHNEIDYEAATNLPNDIQTNIYANEPLGVGNPQSNPISGTLTDDHTYRIEWFKDAIRWLVDGQLVRIETDNIPQQAMALHLNIWAPGEQWPEAYSAALNPVTDPAANTSYYFNVDSVNITRLSSISFFTTTDITPPIITAITPAEGANGVAVTDNIVLAFSEEIRPGTGSVVIHSGSATGTVVESYDAATSANLAISGKTLTINPTSNLEASTHYYVTLGNGSVNDLSDNHFSESTIEFTTADPYVKLTTFPWTEIAEITGVAAVGALAYFFIL
ncbi:MAG: Ig-like domain-containing protein [Chlorobium sp.]